MRDLESSQREPAQGGPQDTGCVVIGRNEGPRLRECLESVMGRFDGLVYVDSGSTDESVELAESLGVPVHSLNPSMPFSAARGRCEGLAWIRERSPGLAFVQFVDGDCVIDDGWFESGRNAMARGERLGAVFGRFHERNRHATVFKRLLDMEWSGPVGEVNACGGIALFRIAAYDEAGGYDQTVKAGEEPELCLRLRRCDWKIERIDAEMMEHDAGDVGVMEWWHRNVRTGFAWALGASRHGDGPERFCVHEVRRVLFWGAAVPLLAFGPLAVSGGLSGIGLLSYGYPFRGAYRAVRSQGRSRGDSLAYGLSCTLGKLPQLIGWLRWRIQAARFL